jgi:diguanylate cyclase (GGDEF)-like protein
MYERIDTWLPPILVGVAASFLGFVSRQQLAGRFVPLLALSAAAALAAWISVSGGASRSVRLALGFVLAATLLLPAPGGVLVALAACLFGRGGGIAGPSRRGVAMCVAIGAAATIAQVYRELRVPYLPSPSAGTLVHLLVLYALVQVSTHATHAMLDLPRRDPAARGGGAPLRLAAIEGVNVVLAWLLFAISASGARAPQVALAAIVILGAFALRKLDLARQGLVRSNTALAARVSELATLHSIGREILSSLEPDRVFAIVERECRKIFEVDFFFVARTDRTHHEIHIVFRGRAEDPAQEIRLPLGRGLASCVVLAKRGMRIDYFRDTDADLPFRPEVADSEIRSALAVPLTVQDKVIGVLSVQSRKPFAYDDAQLSVLTTIAQQAAVAMENARHHEMATIDSLTRLFLRDYFFRRLEEEHERARRYRSAFALLMMDLDDFKSINDVHGHLAGDRYLRALGTVIHDRLRAADLACRYGGDEFCLLLPETDEAGAVAFADRMRSAIGDLAVDGDGPALRTTVSIGIALVPEHDTGDLRDLLLRADQALYQAKRAGRDRVVLYDSWPERSPAAKAV